MTTPKSFFGKPLFWITLLILAIGSSFFLASNFEKANPLVSIDVQMNREQALKHAELLSEKYSIGTSDFKQSAAFTNNSTFQNYAELEGGGLEEFKRIISNGTYQSYRWKVRQFKENEVSEATFYFTPKGEPYGFWETLSEDKEGNNVSVDEAQQIAESAAGQWNINLNNYELAETSKEEQPSGRIDHEFTYELKTEQLNECKFRLAIEVSGDKVTKVYHHVKVPDDFERRYTEMRSANNTISTIGSAMLFILYGLAGIGIGLFFLMKRRYLVWKKALYWSIGIGLGIGLLMALNQLPLSWFSYDTSTSAANFISQQILQGLLVSLGMGGIIFITALAGEGLGRYAFPKQIQFWKVWGKNTGASKQILGQTLGAYLFLPIVLAIDVAYYLFTTHTLGWWNPAGTLSDPNVLAEVMPWFTSIAISLQAGFWEEIICRALPLAGVYLLVRNLKTKNLWMLLTLLAQTIIFGMLHAGYPQSPSYARVLEMVIPFFIFGLIYLRFGLLPVIITHYAIDVFWISLPLWVASSEGIWINRILVLLLFLLPLFIVLFRRIKMKKWTEVAPEALNEAFQPLPEKEKTTINIEDKTTKVSSQPYLKTKWLAIAAVIGLALWIIGTFPAKTDAPNVSVKKEEAIEIARLELKSRYNFNADGWMKTTKSQSPTFWSHRFVWRENSPEVFKALQEDFLYPPHWIIRYVRTKVDVEDRAEEFYAYVGIDGSVLEIGHKWPEKRTSESLDENDAITLAKTALQNFAPKSENALKLISVTPTKRESRTDWEITFADTANYIGASGQGRFIIQISGNEASLLKRKVFIPEEWERNYEKQRSTISIINMTGTILFFSLMILGIVLGFINWSRKRFSLTLFKIFATVAFAISVLGILNGWGGTLADYNTGLPFQNYLIMISIQLLIGIVFTTLASGVLGGFSCQLTVADWSLKNAVLKATLIGIALSGAYQLSDFFIASTHPTWPEIAILNDFIPAISTSTDALSSVIFGIVTTMLLFYIANLFTKKFSRLRCLAVAFIFIVAFAEAGINIETVQEWMITGIARGVIMVGLYLLLKRQLGWLPIVLFIPMAFSNLSTLFQTPIQEVIIGAILSVFVWYTLVFLWHKGLKKCA